MKKLFLLVCIFLVGCVVTSADPNCSVAKNNVAQILGNMKRSTESLNSYSAIFSLSRFLIQKPCVPEKSII